MTPAIRLSLQLTGIAVFVGAWELAGRRMGDPLLAPPSTVAKEYVALLRDGAMLRELAGSLRQMLIGFGAACVVGIPLGVLMGRLKRFDAALHPWVSMGVVTSVAAVVPLLILMFGTGFLFRVAVVFLASVWYIVLTTYHGARGFEPRWIDVGRAFGASPAQRFCKILLPGLFPYLMTAARLGLLHAIRAMVVAEMFVIVGYGGLIHNAGIATSTAPLLGLLLTLMMLGVFSNWLLRQAGRRMAPWYDDRAAAR